MADEKNNPNTESEQVAEPVTEETVVEAQDAADAAENQVDAEQLARELAEAVSEIETLKDQMLRIQADAQNVRRRAEMDVEKAHKFGIEKFVNEMLPVVDSLERAIETFGDEEAHKPMREGVEMTLNMLVSGLGKFQVEQVAPEGQPFDPELHQAMSMVDVPGAEANTVVAVMQKGYTLSGRLVRPAMVMVAKA
ncbi:nucleotide exchange factor GrpE [Neptuniibacter sp. CAU 1671]|uniref:nucleotide exchange factor GrpE n=1 Tax=Neptuniibacter sp. CAU 1671 TaxID=3032593 RepID=UPI0023D9C97F|nr:nucleotide exchange factor GrpE [Neptuniibacter sp. CAU 1671]MDF2181256.1 nucleotide exchange factor GrpE [Neptuniibacter sp. CAU 1671]